jgi:hypothetical protein
MTALDIPELLLAVLGHLDQSSLARCSLVCHAWNEPATELMWAQVQDLEHLVVKSIPESTLKHFKHPSFYHLLTMPYPELIPQSQDTTEEVRPGQVSPLFHCPTRSGLTQTLRKDSSRSSIEQL